MLVLQGLRYVCDELLQVDGPLLLSDEGLAVDEGLHVDQVLVVNHAVVPQSLVVEELVRLKGSKERIVVADDEAGEGSSAESEAEGGSNCCQLEASLHASGS